MTEIKAYVEGQDDARVTLVSSGFGGKVLVILETATGDLEIERMDVKQARLRHPEYEESP